MSGVRIAGEAAVLDDPLAHRGEVEAVVSHDAARDIRDARHARALRGELAGRDAADVPEALHDAAPAGELKAEALARALDHHDDADAGGLVPEDRAADRDRLPRDDLGHRVALLHRVRVHHPRHRLLVRRHVRRGNVVLRADDVHELRREPARDALQLPLREVARTAPHAAFCAPVGEAQQGALPRHPHRERRALAERDVGVVAHPALRRPEHRRMLHAVAGEAPELAGVEVDRDRDDCRALGKAEPFRDRRIGIRVRQRLLELRERLPIEGRIPLELRLEADRLRHAMSVGQAIRE